MLGRTNYIVFLFGIILVQATFAQVNRYMVYFTDKANVQYTTEKPEEFLSERAITRRANQNIDIRSEDLPVDPNYISQIHEAGAEIFYKSKWLNAVLIQLDESLLGTLKQLDFIDSVHYVAPGSKLGENARTKKKKQTLSTSKVAGKNTTIQNELIGANKMHLEGYRGEDMQIAVFDAGFIGTNTSPFLAKMRDEGRLKVTRDFVNGGNEIYKHSSHGTLVLSCMAADQDDIIGTAPSANYYLFVTEDVSSEYRIEEYNWIFAAEWADSAGVDIINTSLNYYDFDDEAMNYTYEQMNGETAIITLGAKLAFETGMLIVCSAGNEGNNAWQHIAPPADAENALAIGAIDTDVSLASFSSIGPTADGRIKPELVAVGQNTVIGDPGGNIVESNGTSFSAPLVAGLAAGFWQANPHLSNIEVRDYLIRSGHLHHVRSNTMGSGYPRFDQANTTYIDLSNAVIKSTGNTTAIHLIADKPFHNDGELLITLSGSDAQSGQDFITDPVSEQGMITLPISQGNDTVTWTIDDLGINTYYSLSFTVSHAPSQVKFEEDNNFLLVTLSNGTILAINDMHNEALDFQLYPNPVTNSELFLSFNDSKYANRELIIEIIDMRGQKVFSKYVYIDNAMSVTLPTQNLKQGAYLLKVIDQQNQEGRLLLKK